MSIHKIIIIGSGPSALMAAIYSSRAMLNPILITGKNVGGQLMLTSDVDNFPGYPDGASGEKIIKNLTEQAKKFGTEFIYTDVININSEKQPFQIKLKNEDTLLTNSIIIATGAQALWLNLENEDKLCSRGISTCAVCDGFFFKDTNIIVIGGGDTAMEDATYLTRYAKKVTIIHRRDKLRASKFMIQKAKKNDKIYWKLNTVVKKWFSNKYGELEGAILETPEGEEKIECEGAFIAIGHKPSTDFIKQNIETDEQGYIILKQNTMTSVPGIFACGDVTDKRYKQAITAAGDGCKAAMDCEKWLEHYIDL